MTNVSHKHVLYVNQFQDQYERLDDLKKQELVLKSQQEELNQQLLQSPPDQHLNIRQQLVQVEEQLEQVQHQLDRITNRVIETEYYLNAGPILHQYYQQADCFNRLNQQFDQALGLSEPTITKVSDTCPQCHKALELYNHEALAVCPECNCQYPIMMESTYTTYNNQMHEGTNFFYTRLSHFKDHLAQAQAKESKQVPEEVYDYIMYEMIQNNVRRLTFSMAKKFLRKYAHKGFNRYYNNIPQIVSTINGDPPLVITPEIEDQLCTMFLQAQESFKKYCPENRSNFLSYSYVLYKLCQILNYNEFLPYFKLLKSVDKLRQQDLLWKKICLDNNWDYYPSV